MSEELAFGAPGIAPTWTSSAKDLVTTALGPGRLWATVGFGILNEVYWPATGTPQIRDLGFIVAGKDRWFEVKRVNRYRISTPEPHVPLPRVVHDGEGYRLTLEFLPAPLRDALLVSYQLDGDGLHLYPLLAPHLGGSGLGNSAWVGNGLYAAKDTNALCLLSDCGFARASAGYVGASDGWQDFARHKQMRWEFAQATDGNVALTGELQAAQGVLALAFADTPEGARTLAASALAEGYTPIRERFIEHWERWATCLRLPDATEELLGQEARRSAAVLKAHEDRTYPGAIVASLSVPWGNTSDDAGGYHLVWTRDTVEAGLALLAAGDRPSARRMIAYLAATQAPDGHWAQNFYPDGRPLWTGIQLDEVGFPILFAAKLRELGEQDAPLTGAMVRQAASYLARAGPVSPQDRWEENPGASPFTLAVEVAALVAAAPWLEPSDRAYARALADCWNERIEEWTYVEGTELAQTHSVAGYYIRIGAPGSGDGLRGSVEVKNRGGETIAASALVGLDFLYLARLGLRNPNDARFRDTLTVVDALLRVETPNGAAYHRYDEDGYGEHTDGSPFDGSGIGRAWPLLSGERGHGALLQGENAEPYLLAMAAMTGPGGLIPEQVWDSDPIPERLLYPGKPTGSAMPLVWAHAEFIKLLIACDTGRPVEQLDSTTERYRGER
ncbi:MAG: glucan 1,4-alpha-glucosidase, partial [Actinobacteria bacterium]|nr:glucan 1,4-alpha-glucosidase [Actinomycetota bacterium]